MEATTIHFLDTGKDKGSLHNKGPANRFTFRDGVKALSKRYLIIPRDFGFRHKRNLRPLEGYPPSPLPPAPSPGLATPLPFSALHSGDLGHKRQAVLGAQCPVLSPPAPPPPALPMPVCEINSSARGSWAPASPQLGSQQGAESWVPSPLLTPEPPGLRPAAQWTMDRGAPPPLCLRQGWRFRACGAEGLRVPTFPKDGIDPQKRPQVPFEIQETAFSEQLLSRHKKSFQDKSRLSCLSGKYKACSRPFKSTSVIRTRLQPGGKRGREVMGGCWGGSGMWAAWQARSRGALPGSPSLR